MAEDSQKMPQAEERRNAALTDYRVVGVKIVGPRGGLQDAWHVVTGKYDRVVASFTTKREAMDELAELVNNAHREHWNVVYPTD